MLTSEGQTCSLGTAFTRFYGRYDEYFLYNKVVTFLYIIDEGEPAIKQIEARLVENGGASFSERYLESIRAEIFFTALHGVPVASGQESTLGMSH